MKILSLPKRDRTKTDAENAAEALRVREHNKLAQRENYKSVAMWNVPIGERKEWLTEQAKARWDRMKRKSARIDREVEKKAKRMAKIEKREAARLKRKLPLA